MRTVLSALIAGALIAAACASGGATSGTTSAPGSVRGVWRYLGSGTQGESGQGLVIFTERHYSTTAQDADLKAWAGKTLPTLEKHLQSARDLNKKLAAPTY